MADHAHTQGPQTTGHVWDEDLQEYTNPLPTWWLYGFYVTVAFAIVYWLIYPSWPVGTGFLTGFGQVSYTSAQGEEESWHWNTRAKLLRETQEAAALQRPYYERLGSMSVEQISKDPEMSSFVTSAGKSLFADNCAACHQAGGAGQIGHYPNLADDDWLYGGAYQQIEQSIAIGRRGYMPPFGETLSADQIDALAHYVLSLSLPGAADPGKVARGAELFRSEATACFYCHGDDAKGRHAIGAPNLTDGIWLWADVPTAADAAGKLDLLRKVISAGVNRGVMPAWAGRLSPEQIKLLAVYVHELGGGR